jgi:hypothetical protein
MSRTVVIAWIPWFCCLVAAFAALWLVLRFSGARLAPGKLRRLHRCEEGSVQTLSFVLTLPFFIMLLLFIVQVADLMIAIGLIHYAAFAAARSAIVWLPANVTWPPGNFPVYEPANTLGSFSMEVRNSAPWLTTQLDLSQHQSEQKYNKVGTTAMLACALLSPAYNLERPPKLTSIVTAAQTLYPALVPGSRNYPRIRNLIAKKISYSARNTQIAISGVDRNMHVESTNGQARPTYNPYPDHIVLQPDPMTGRMMAVRIPWNPNEIGWEDPITVTVYHNYALMPGPGRFLAAVLTPGDGTQDQVSPIIRRSQGLSAEQYNGGDARYQLYFIRLSAAVTMSNEGFKSVMPYVFLQQIE